MKCKQVIATMLLAAVTTLALTSCAKQAPVAVNQADKMKGELSVYYVDYAEQTADKDDFTFETTSLLQNLQNKYPDLELEATAFPSRESFMSQASTELNAGKGPDLFVLDYGTMLNWNKMASNGIFENLTPYIKEDLSYHADDYFEDVVKAGQIDGKQYVLPLSFYIISLFTSESKMIENKVDFKDKYDYKDVLSAITTSINKANQDDEVIPLALVLNRMDYLSCFMQAFGMPFVDYEKNCADLDKESLLNLCDFLKNLYPYINEAFSAKYDNISLTQNVKNVEYTMDNLNYIEALVQHEMVFEYIDDVSVPLTMPKYDNPNESSALVYRYTAVNGNSKNKQLAYDTAKALMDISVDSKTSPVFPVNKKVFNSWLQQYNDKEWFAWIDNNAIPYNDDLPIEELTERMTNIRYVTIENSAVMQIVNDGMMPYIEGTGTFDDCYDETVNKLNLYINE